MRRARARLDLPVLAVLAVLAPLASASCGIRYPALNPQIGVPSPPTLRIDSVTVRDTHPVPGEHADAHGDWSRPMVTAAGLEERGASKDGERTVLWEVRIQAGARTEIADMIWSPAEAPPCAGGHPALDILVDDVAHNHWIAPDLQVHWERPVALAGDHVVAGRFHEDPPLLHAASVVDVLLARRDGDRTAQECVRLPATGPGLGYWVDKTWSIGGRLSWRRALPFSSSSNLGFAVSLGRWVGSIRIGVEGMFGGTDDSGTDGPSGTGWCFVTPGPDCDRIDVGGGSLEASGIGWRWDRWALGWSLAFESLYARIKHTQAGGGPTVERHAASVGPRLGLALLRVAPDITGVARTSPTRAWGFELFAAAGQIVSGDAAGAPPVTLGVALVGF